MLEKLSTVEDRYRELESKLVQGDTINDQGRYRKILKEMKGLEPIIKAVARYRKVLEDLEQAEEILSTDQDEEMIAMAKEEAEGKQAEKASE